MEKEMIYNPHLEGDAFYWQDGPTGVLLCHGFTATTAEVRLMAQVLHDQGYTIDAPLLPGHYAHPQDLNQVRWQDWVSACEASYQRLKAACQQVILGGESTGALLALYLAAQHPEAAGVLAYAPALKLNMSPWQRLQLYLLAPYIPYISKSNMGEDNTPWQGYPVSPLKGVIQLLRLQAAVQHQLNAIHQPLLIVQGRLDRTVHPGVPETIARGVSSKQVEVHWMEHSGHVVILDQEHPEVERITLRFLKDVLGRN